MQEEIHRSEANFRMVILNKGYLKKENRIIDLQYVDIMNDCVWAYDRVADKA